MKMKKNSKLFLDYCQLYLEICDAPSTDVYTILLNNQALQLTMKNSQSLENSERGIFLYFNETSVRAHLTGKFFLDDNMSDDIAKIRQFLKCINVHKSFRPALISRLDIAENEYGLTLKNYYIKNTNNSEVTEITNNGKLNTIYLGKRGSKAVIYRCYDKKADEKGHMHSLERFGTVEYVRHEYELMRDVLTRYGISESKDLIASKLEDVYKWISHRKRVEFVAPEYVNIEKPKKIYIAKKSNADLKKLHKMVFGIYQNNFAKKEGLNSINTIRSEVYGI